MIPQLKYSVQTLQSAVLMQALPRNIAPPPPPPSGNVQMYPGVFYYELKSYVVVSETIMLGYNSTLTSI